MQKKKCLLILPRSVFPTVSGYAIKNRYLITFLNEYFELSLIVISNKRASEEEILFYKKHSFNFSFYYFSKISFLLNATRALFSSNPIQVELYYFSSIARKVDDLLLDADVAIGVLVRTINYLKKIPAKTFKVFDMVDSVGLNYMHSKNRVTSLFWKVFYTIEANRLIKYERKSIASSNITYLFNIGEVNYWNKYGTVKWLPHGVKSNIFSFDETDEKYSSSIAFIGKMDYQPNIDAIKWYIENVHQKLLHCEIPLIIIGAYPTHEIKSLAEKYNNICVTGYIEDPYVILKSVMAVIAPMRTGGGIQNKVLEAMALGKINIISSLASLPIVGGVNKEHFLVADSPIEYRDYLLDIKNNYNDYVDIGIRAKMLVENSFTWELYKKEYLFFLCDK